MWFLRAGLEPVGDESYGMYWVQITFPKPKQSKFINTSSREKTPKDISMNIVEREKKTTHF